jgi:hypothetical protein
MGQSTDAKLAWGVDLGEEVPAWLFEEFGMEPGGDRWELNEALNAVGLGLESHCSDACMMYTLCVEESLAVAWRGQPVKIERLDVPPEWPAEWERVKRAGDPGWLLFSWWC